MTSVHTLSLIHIYGQTDWNLAGKIQGKTDVPLNEEGRAQARFLADAMKSRPAAKVFTSPLKRARETAQALSLIHIWQDYQVVNVRNVREKIEAFWSRTGREESL